MSCVATLPARS